MEGAPHAWSCGSGGRSGGRSEVGRPPDSRPWQGPQGGPKRVHSSYPDVELPMRMKDGDRRGGVRWIGQFWVGGQGVGMATWKRVTPQAKPWNAGIVQSRMPPYRLSARENVRTEYSYLPAARRSTVDRVQRLLFWVKGVRNWCSSSTADNSPASISHVEAVHLLSRSPICDQRPLQEQLVATRHTKKEKNPSGICPDAPNCPWSLKTIGF